MKFWVNILILVVVLFQAACQGEEVTPIPAITEGVVGKDVQIKCLNSDVIKEYRGIVSAVFTREIESPPKTQILCNYPQCFYERFKVEVNLEQRIVTLTISKASLNDSGIYSCHIGANSARPELVINQTPKIKASLNGVKPKAGELKSVATCEAIGSKPAPTDMWFENAKGARVYTESEIVIDETKSYKDENMPKDYIISLKKTFSSSDDNELYTCVVEHKTLDSALRMQMKKNLDVYYPPVITFKPKGTIKDGVFSEQENTKLVVECEIETNPYSSTTTKWTFVPRNSSFKLPQGQLLPKNFRQDGSFLISDNLCFTSEDCTNSGTFICTANNTMFSPVKKFFELDVLATPTTPAPTTPDYTVGMEPRQAGSDAALVGGIVAVACFVALVFIILIVRYFCTHKATYHTNEARATNDFEAVQQTKSKKPEDDDSEILDADEELLAADKRRPEYFM